MRWKLPILIHGVMKKSPRLIQAGDTQTLQEFTLQRWMDDLKDYLHCVHSASGCVRDYLLPGSNGIPLQDPNQQYLWISNSVTYRDLNNWSLPIVHGQVYMWYKYSWGKFRVSIRYNRYLPNESNTASWYFQSHKLYILFMEHTSIAYDKCEWIIDHWLRKTTPH